VECDCDPQNTLEITSIYFKNDTLGRDGFIVTKQELKLRREGIAQVVSNPATKVDHIVMNGESIRILGTIIRKVKCIKQGNDFIYSIYGSNSMDSPHEFFGILSKDGEWLWYFYGSTEESFKSHGKLKRVTSKYSEVEIRSLKDMLSVLPMNQE
jgi:hypothetical protein